MSVRHTGRYICSPGKGVGRGGGRLLVNLVPMLEQKKKTRRKYTLFKLGSAQRCQRLGSENGILVGKGYVYSNLIKKKQKQNKTKQKKQNKKNNKKQKRCD